MKFFARLFDKVKRLFKKSVPNQGAETIGVMFEVEHHEGGYYTVPVFIETENHKLTPVETEIKKDA